MMTAPPSAALVALLGKEIVIEVDALLTVIVNDLVPTWLFPSVARTVCEYVPAAKVSAAVTVVPERVTPEMDDPRDHV
jgi:hypothetical protein